MYKTKLNILRLAAGLAASALLHACSSGSGGSDVGNQSRVAPTARAQLLNGGTDGVFREGSEVIMTGKASEDADGPVLHWRWQQTAGPGVELVELNSTTVTFTAPDIETSTDLSFELSVEDSSGETGRSSLDVTVVPAQDADKFLSLDVRTGSAESFDRFKVVAALVDNADTGATPKPFTLSVQAYLVYPPRSAPGTVCTVDVNDFAAGIPATTANGCFVELLEDLTPDPLPGGGTGLESAWPAGVEVPMQSEQAHVDSWWNARFTLAVPRLDVRDFNQRFVVLGQRNRLLDQFAASNARIALEFSLTAPENQDEAMLILTELSSTPIVIPAKLTSASNAVVQKIVLNDGSGLPTRAVIPQETLTAALPGRETALTAEVYYRTVDPDGTRTTLNDWLLQAGFASDANGTLLPDAEAGNGEFAHAVYLNNYDLGFGRDMYSRGDEFGNVYSFVTNYATLEGAIRKLDSIVTVVMEYSALRDPSSPDKFVKFFTYVDNGSGDSTRVTSMNFDGRGERFTPGNCVACHGGLKPPGVTELVYDSVCGNRNDAVCYAWPATNRGSFDVADGDLQATFLPWDLESFLYADTDPAIVDAPVPFDGVSLAAELSRDYGDFSRSAQQAQLKKLNEAAYATYCDDAQVQGCLTDVARRLVEHWYGGVDQSGNLISSTFDDSTPPPGWGDGDSVEDPANPGQFLTNPDDAADIYHGVYAQHCRMCHTNVFDSTLRFSTYQHFIVQEPLISAAVYGRGTMPAARLTMDRFWSPFDGADVAGTILADHIALISNSAPAAAPGVAEAVFTGFEQAPGRGEVVRLDASDSTFANRFSWTLTAPAGSAATLVGEQTEQPSFRPDLPGDYDVTLTVNSGTANEDTASATQTVANRSPMAVNDLYPLELNASVVLQNSVLSGAMQDSDPDGDSLSVSLVDDGLPNYGTLSLGADGAFTYTYTGNVFSPPGPDGFNYSIADGFGGTAVGAVTISLVGAPDTTPPSVPTSLSAVDISTAAQAASQFQVRLSWVASSDNNQVIGYNIYRNGGVPVFVASTAGPGTTVTYTDTTVASDTTYTYTVAALDAENESAQSGGDAVEVVTSFRQDIQTGWGAGTQSIWASTTPTCTSCHSGGTPSGDMDLSGTAAQVFAALHDGRIDEATPVNSEILCRPLSTGQANSCAHTGGNFFVVTDSEYQTILRWIVDGAPNN